jgi:hypothetical protein
MRHSLHLSALIAVSLIGLAAPASAQGPGPGAQIGTAPGTGAVPPVGSPNTAPSTTTGMGAGSNTHIDQPGVPTTSTLGKIGTGTSPSGLPGDDPAHPGFPARVGH